jgi:hypothetical protein
METPITPKRRRRWPWIVLAILLTPFVLVGGAVLNYLTLDHEASVLRHQVMRATEAKWDTTVQFSVGRPTFAVLRSCFAAFPSKDTLEARQALRAVRSASVGVYQLQTDSTIQSRIDIMHSADVVMRRRGWERAVGVRDSSSTVVIFFPQKSATDGRVCVAVVDGTQLVVVSAKFDPTAMVDLIKLHQGQGDWRGMLPVSI